MSPALPVFIRRYTHDLHLVAATPAVDHRQMTRLGLEQTGCPAEVLALDREVQRKEQRVLGEQQLLVTLADVQQGFEALLGAVALALGTVVTVGRVERLAVKPDRGLRLGLGPAALAPSEHVLHLVAKVVAQHVQALLVQRVLQATQHCGVTLYTNIHRAHVSHPLSIFAPPCQ